ncbi:MAG: DUF3137 domain-containing protein [Clostridia bacterium]|nr:DUF3137 domain-containing protein [Clostridia bacterium]
MKQRNFKEIYDAIYSRVGKIMEARRKAALRKNVFAFLITLIIWVAVLMNGLKYYGPLMGVGLVLTIILLTIIINKINKEYKQTYKEQVINEIVKQSNPNLKYDYKDGIGSKLYAESQFDFGWDRYHTEDRIYGEIEDGVTLNMAQVHTEEEHETTDSDGHTSRTYVTTFLGLYGIITLKTVTPADFMIKSNSKFSKFKKNRIEMESAEFEKYYDVYSSKTKDLELRQSAMEILTPETIEEFVKIRNMFKKAVNVRVCRDKIYFRIEVGDIFEPPTFKSSIDFEMLRRYFLIIDVPRMLYEILIDNILVMYGDKGDKEKRNLSKMSQEEKEEYLKNKKAAEKATEETSYFSHN